jgi:hypothetical protein
MNFLKKTINQTCYGLNSASTYPSAIWDGDSGNRNSDNNNKVAPDHRDWARMIAEIRAVQQSNQGYDPDNILNSVGVVATKTGLSVIERGNAAIHKTILTLDEVEIITTDGTTPATDAHWGTQPLYTFPVGRILFLGSHMVFPLGKIIATVGGGGGLSDTADLEIGVGTTARGNASNFALAAAEHNIIPEQTGVDLVAAISDAIESSVSTAVLFFDGTSSCVANLNIITSDDADAGTSADLLKISGTITMLWTMLGDE